MLAYSAERAAAEIYNSMVVDGVPAVGFGQAVVPPIYLRTPGGVTLYIGWILGGRTPGFE